MLSTPTLNISPVGLTRQDKCVLRSLFAVTSGRSSYNYRLLEPDENTLPQIKIVSVESSPDMDFNSAGSVVTITIGDDSKCQTEQLYIFRPLTLSKVMGVLTRATAQVFGDAKSIEINDNQSIELLNIQDDNIIDERSSKKGNKFTALVVDDSISVRKVMEIHLTSLGTEVVLADTGEQALRLLEKQTFDIIFLDVVLPAMDGYQVCKIIKSKNQHKSTPICMLTSKSSTFNRVKGTLYGCDVYLTKPIQAKILTELIGKYIIDR